MDLRALGLRSGNWPDACSSCIACYTCPCSREWSPRERWSGSRPPLRTFCSRFCSSGASCFREPWMAFTFIWSRTFRPWPKPRSGLTQQSKFFTLAVPDLESIWLTRATINSTIIATGIFPLSGLCCLFPEHEKIFLGFLYSSFLSMKFFGLKKKVITFQNETKLFEKRCLSRNLGVYSHFSMRRKTEKIPCVSFYTFFHSWS